MDSDRKYFTRNSTRNSTGTDNLMVGKKMVINLKNWLLNYDFYNQYIIGYTPTSDTKKLLSAMVKTGTTFVEVRVHDNSPDAINGVDVVKIS
jgi:hypothetical protein